MKKNDVALKEARLRGAEFLNRARLMKEQVETQYQQVAVLDSLTKRITSCIRSDIVSRSRDVTAGEDTIIRLTEAKEELLREVDKMMELRNEIGEMIARVKDRSQRIALVKRYLCDMKMEEIGKDMKYDVTWARRMLRRGEEAVGLMLLESDS